MLGHVREKLRYPCSVLTSALEIPKRFHDALIGAHSRFRQNALIGEIQHAAVAAIQLRLVIEAIDLADPAGHEKEDYPLRFGNDMGKLWEKGVENRVGGGFLRGDSSGSHITEPAGHTTQNIATGNVIGLLGVRHDFSGELTFLGRGMLGCQFS